MNIREEKRFLYEAMRSLIEERRELTSEIHTIRIRIDELSKLEETVLKDIDLQTYMQMHQEHEEAKKKALVEKVLPSPKNYSMAEARDMEPIKEEPKVLTQNEMMENGIKEMLENGTNTVVLRQVPKYPEKEYKKEIDNIKENKKKNRVREDRTPVYNYIRRELSKSVKPISKRELKIMIERDLNIKLKDHNMTDIIKHLMKIDDAFKRAATNGYYTYRSQ